MPPHVCPWYAAYFFDNPLRRLVHDPKKILGEYVRPGATVLDVGCGMGYFSLGLAGLVGETGRVISVDLQQKMLDILSRRAARAGLPSRVETRLARFDHLGIDDLAGQVDLALAFWMVHEVPNQSAFLAQIQNTLKKDGALVVAEPFSHVKEKEFQETLSKAADLGLKALPGPRVALSRAVVFRLA